MRSPEENVDEHLFAQYSFDLIASDCVFIKSPLLEIWKGNEITFDEFIGSYAACIRSWTEPIIKQVLIKGGRAPDNISIILNKFWALFEDRIRETADVVIFGVKYAYVVLKKR